MYGFGIFLLFVGAILVYGTAPVSKALKMTTIKGILMLKVSGLLLAVVGAIFLFFNA